MTTFVRDIPSETLDAALVDGCTLAAATAHRHPAGRAGMVAVFLVALLSTWNNFLIPLIFSRAPPARSR
jgi:ABC-type glycerol-3-phosphate transport system permease component